MLTCPINNGPINLLTLIIPSFIRFFDRSRSCLSFLLPYTARYNRLNVNQRWQYCQMVHGWTRIVCLWLSVMLACCIKCVKVGWSMLVTFSTFLITLSAPATNSLQNLSVGGCEFCRSEYFICSCANHSFKLQIYFYIYILFCRSIIACEGKPKKTFSNQKHITTQIRGPLHIHPNSWITTK